MENIYFVIIIALLVGIIYWIHTSHTSHTQTSNPETKHEENFDSNILTLTPYSRCEKLGSNKFMIRDLRTKLWLVSGQEEGFNKFLPGRFGVPLMMSETPDEYLPLRTIVDPNEYLVVTYSGNGIRTVSNPTSTYFVIQVFIYNGFNVLGYISESNTQHYLIIDNNGYISNTIDPEQASIVEIITL